MNRDDVKVVNNEPADRFETTVDGETAILSYRREGDRIVFDHTGVPPPIAGRGVGSKLVHTALEYARAGNLRVVPVCSFVASYIRRHPEYRALVADSWR